MVYKFYIGRVSCFEFMCANALSCQENTVWIQISTPSGSSSFCTFFCNDHWNLGVRCDIIVSSDVEHTTVSYSLHLHQFCQHLLQYKASSFRTERYTNLWVERWGVRRKYITMSTFQKNSTWLIPMAFDLTCHRNSSQSIAPGKGSIWWHGL